MDEYTLAVVEQTTGTSVTLLTEISPSQAEEIEEAISGAKQANGLLLALILSEPNADYVLSALSKLEQNYDLLQQNTRKARHDFSQAQFVKAYQALYEHVASADK